MKKLCIVTHMKSESTEALLGHLQKMGIPAKDIQVLRDKGHYTLKNYANGFPTETSITLEEIKGPLKEVTVQ